MDTIYARLITIYVDSVHGSDSNTGAVDNPYLTLAQALLDVKTGGNIVLQAGTYTVPSSITRDVTIRNAYGSYPTITTGIDVTDAQVSIGGVTFSNAGITVTNTGRGSVSVTNCVFNSIDYPIVINSATYVSIHSNTFNTYVEAIKVDTCYEMTVSSNVFHSGYRAITLRDVSYIDIYQNTIFGAADLGTVGSGDTNARVIYVTINLTRLLAKSFSLPTPASANSYGYDVAINAINGTTFQYGKDYVVNSGITVDWNGLGLESELTTGDILRVIYSEEIASSTGEAISIIGSNATISRIDSNNITDAALGVYFTSDLRIRNNNFNGVTTQIQGSSSDYTGNITGAPSFQDPTNFNFRLNPDSPDIDAADPNRWSTVLQEMGVGLTGGGYTGIFTVQRAGVSPYNRSLDQENRHRLIRSDADDIGAYEFPITGTNPESLNYVGEQGYDLDYVGSITGPYSTPDAGFSGTNGVVLMTNYAGASGVDSGITAFHFGRFKSKDLALGDQMLLVGNSTERSIAFVYPSFPSHGATGIYVGEGITGVGATGSKENPFRTIQEALNQLGNTGVVYVFPGLYPSFQGVSGTKIVGVPSLERINYNTSTYSPSTAASWTGVDSAIVNSKTVIFPSDDEIHSTFTFGDNWFLKFNMAIDVNSLEFRAYNSQNYIAVRKTGDSLIFRHMSGGSTYTTTTTSTDRSYRVDVELRDAVASYTVAGVTGSYDRVATLVTGLDLPWAVSYAYTGIGAGATGAVSNLVVTADWMVGAGSTGTAVGKKVFGLLGVTGIDSLRWYSKNLF